MNAETGKWVILAGLVTLLTGIIIYYFHNKLHWIGRLPGDILIERGHFKLYIPLSSMTIASLLLTLLFNILKKMLH